MGRIGSTSASIRAAKLVMQAVTISRLAPNSAARIGRFRLRTAAQLRKSAPGPLRTGFGDFEAGDAFGDLDVEVLHGCLRVITCASYCDARVLGIGKTCSLWSEK